MNSSNDIQVFKRSKKAINRSIFAAFIMIMMLLVPLTSLSVVNFLFNEGNMWIILFAIIFAIPFNIKFVFEAFSDIYEINKYKIVNRRLFKEKEILLNDIKGFHIVEDNGKYLHLISRSSGKPFIISLTIIDQPDKIKTWAENNFTDLDALYYKEEMEKIQSDINIGINKEERILSLRKAKIWAKIINSIGAALSAWVLLYPHPLELSLISCLIFPIVLLLLMKYFHGLIKFDVEKDKIYPSVGLATFLPGAAMSVRAMFNWHILILLDLIIPVLVISLAVFMLYYQQMLEENRKLGKLLLFYFPFLLYGVGAAIIINGVFVDTIPKVYKAVVIEKRIGGRDKNNYYFDLDSFSKFKNPNEIEVSKETYDTYNLGDEYPIMVQVGRLGIPWYIKNE